MLITRIKPLNLKNFHVLWLIRDTWQVLVLRKALAQSTEELQRLKRLENRGLSDSWTPRNVIAENGSHQHTVDVWMWKIFHQLVNWKWRGSGMFTIYQLGHDFFHNIAVLTGPCRELIFRPETRIRGRNLTFGVSWFECRWTGMRWEFSHVYRTLVQQGQGFLTSGFNYSVRFLTDCSGKLYRTTWKQLQTWLHIEIQVVGSSKNI